MKPKLIALLADCKTYIVMHEKVAKKGTVTVEQTRYYQEFIELLPLLQKAISNADEKRVDAAINFNELYNKNFTYLNKFTNVSQSSIKHILAYKRLAQKIAKLYANLAPETIQRQGDTLAAKKKTIDKWLPRFEEQLSSSENKIEVEKHFQKLLEKANAALSAKGLATV